MSSLRDGLEDWDGLFSVVEGAVGIPLIEEMVREARDWGYTGENRLNAIRTIVGNSIVAHKKLQSIKQIIET